MKIKYFIIIILLTVASAQHEKLVVRDFTLNGSIDALVNDYSENLYLIQLDLLNDSLYNLALSALPNLELYAGPSSYHRIMNLNDYQMFLQANQLINLFERHMKIPLTFQLTRTILLFLYFFF